MKLINVFFSLIQLSAYAGDVKNKIAYATVYPSILTHGIEMGSIDVKFKAIIIDGKAQIKIPSKLPKFWVKYIEGIVFEKTENGVREFRLVFNRKQPVEELNHLVVYQIK